MLFSLIFRIKKCSLINNPNNECMLHFINPISTQKFVEFACYPEFQKRNEIINFTKDIGLDIYELNPSSGLILNRLLFSYLNTVDLLKEEGINTRLCDEIFNKVTGAEMNTGKIKKIIGEDIYMSIIENMKKNKQIPD